MADAVPKSMPREHAKHGAKAGRQERRDKRSARRQLRKDILRVAMVVMFFLAVAVVLKNETIQKTLFDIETLRERLHPDRSGLDRVFAYVTFIGIGGLL